GLESEEAWGPHLTKTEAQGAAQAPRGSHQRPALPSDPAGTGTGHAKRHPRVVSAGGATCKACVNRSKSFIRASTERWNPTAWCPQDAVSGIDESFRRDRCGDCKLCTLRMDASAEFRKHIARDILKLGRCHPLAVLTSASRSLAMICSGVCRCRFDMVCP